MAAGAAGSGGGDEGPEGDDRAEGAASMGDNEQGWRWVMMEMKKVPKLSLMTTSTTLVEP
jgi:hypothetical protein